MDISNHSKSTSVIDMLKNIFFSKKQKIKEKSVVPQPPTQIIKSVKLPESLEDKPLFNLQKPVIQSDILQCSYQQNQISLTSYLSDQLFLGVVGSSNANDLKISNKSYLISISNTSQINSLRHLRPYCFDLIISIESNISLLKEIFKSNQRFLLKAKTDNELKQIINSWQTIIQRQTTQKSILLKKIANKFLVKIRLVDNCYWILLNQKIDNLLVQKIQNLGLKKNNKNDQFVFKRMEQSLTYKQYIQLINLKKNKNRELTKPQIYKFMIDHYLMTQQQFMVQSPQIIPISKTDNLFLNNKTHFTKEASYKSSIGEFGLLQNQSMKKLSSFKFQKSDDQNLFDLHLIDRYQDVEDQEQRILSKDQGTCIYKDKRYRTRSCCLQTHQGQNQLKLMLEDDNYFYLDV